MEMCAETIIPTDHFGIRTNFFKTIKAKTIRSYPSGDKLMVLWLWMIALAGEDGRTDRSLMVDDQIPYTPRFLGIKTDYSTDFVEYALNIFLELKMIEIKNGIIFLMEDDSFLIHA